MTDGILAPTKSGLHGIQELKLEETMACVAVFLATGFEEIEAVTIIDVLRRADVVVVTASLGELTVVGSHGIAIVADRSIDDIDVLQFDAVVLPGGMPGSTHLRDDERVRRAASLAAERGRIVAAICAAPIALEAAGVLHGKNVTSYPGCELPSAVRVDERVVEDETIITSCGPGSALEFALTLARRLVGTAVAARVAQAMLVQGGDEPATARR